MPYDPEKPLIVQNDCTAIRNLKRSVGCWRALPIWSNRRGICIPIE
jgi:hypothetical protein